MGPSPTQLIIVLVIIILIFGTKKLRNIGSDLGGALKNFKSAMKDKEEAKANEENEKKIIEGSAEEVQKSNVEEKEKS